jgi:protein-tyrosine-phosphatase
MVDAERVRAADLVVVMDARQEREIRLRFGKRRDAVLILADLLPAFGEVRVIPDPIDQPLETFERVYGQIDECVAALRWALKASERP